MNEVHKLFDDLFLDFIEERGVQVWPELDRRTKIITHWTVQSSKPFKQITKPNLKAALTKLAFEIGDLKWMRNFQNSGKDDN